MDEQQECLDPVQPLPAARRPLDASRVMVRRLEQEQRKSRQAWNRTTARTSARFSLAWAAVNASAPMVTSGSRSAWLGLLWWRLCFPTHQSKLTPTRRLA